MEYKCYVLSKYAELFRIIPKTFDADLVIFVIWYFHLPCLFNVMIVYERDIYVII